MANERFIRDYIDESRTVGMDCYMDKVSIIRNPVFAEGIWPLHSQTVFVVACESGEASVTVEGRSFVINRMGFLIVLSGQLVEGFDTSNDFDGTLLIYSNEFIESLNIGDAYKFYRSVLEKPYVELEERRWDAILHYVNMSLSMISVSYLHPNVGEALRLLTKVFFLMLGWSIHSEYLNENMSLSNSEVMSKFMALVKRYYKTHRDVEFYADKMNITAKYLLKVVKKASGASPLRIIEDHVIIEAKSLLTSTSMSIKEIADLLDFPTQSFFGRYFKRATGMSPYDYRKSKRTNDSI